MWAARSGRARGRDARPTLEALYRAHFGLVWALVGRYGVRTCHREDVVQDVWLTVHRKLPSFDTTASAPHWIAGIARFVAWRHIRSMMRLHRKLGALQAIDRDETGLDRETVALVGAALESLEPIFREAIVSVEIEGWSGPEAAARIGVPLNTLYSRLRLGRSRLRDTLVALERDAGTCEPAPREAMARTWAAIAPVVATPLVKASALGTFGAWWLVPAAAALGIGLVAVVPSRDASAPRIASAAIEPAIAPAVERDASAEAPAVATPTTLAIADPVPVATEDVARPVARAPAPAPVDRDDETTLLKAALAAIGDGDGATALARLHEHETRFPDGALALERRSARVRALCLAGKAAQARGEAQALLRDHPDAPAAIAARDACPP
jgi:RNA polymerase sigma-70 factor (ECF subfamily)